jgi:hypothetical protein
LAKIVGAVPASDRAGLVILRTALVSTVALAFLAGLAGSADAYPRRLRYAAAYSGWYGEISARRIRVASHSRRERPEPKKDPGFGDVPKGPLQIVVNIGTQKVTLYSNGARVAQGPVSTGMPGHPTPLGVFSVIEKDRYHHSNIYSGAPMPYLQRITWSGVALHEGVLPGHPASHGCIRTSHDFAQKLWPLTKLGVRFLVTRAEVTPVDFEHPKLFVPKQKPPESRIAMNGATDGRSTKQPIKLAEAESERGAAVPAPEIVKPAPTKIEERDASETETQTVETIKPLEDVKAVEHVEAAGSLPAAETGDERVKASGTVEPLQPAEAPALPAPVELRKSVEVPTANEPARPVEVTPSAARSTGTPAADDLARPAPTDDPPKPMAPSRMKSADQPVKRTGQVAVFVSRKEKKIFVRQGMVPMFDMPIVIEEPDQPLGTHVFTALAVTGEGAGMRWNLMTIPTDGTVHVEYRASRRQAKEPPKPIVFSKPPSTAAEALNRIQMPKEAVERIGDLLVPGSSLVVSDEGLGRETGRATEFIVLTR